MKNYIWLFGENLGKTTNNNSFYLWHHVVLQADGIDKYLILEKNEKNLSFANCLDESKRKYIVWKNSIKHHLLYLKADMFFVTLSYKDVRPENLGTKKLNYLTVTPVIYLQHGTLAIKKINYNGTDYNNNLFRFVYYNPLIAEQLVNVNGFKPYQLFNGEFHPRYQALLKKATLVENPRTILWFITWREYLGNNFVTKKLLFTIRKILSDDLLLNFLKQNNYKLRLCIHSFFNKEIMDSLLTDVYSENIEWIHADNTDIMDELAESKLLITDYSSVGFDFTFLNRPVILFAPDFEEYSRKRNFYCSNEEFLQYAITSSSILVQHIIKQDYTINGFFKRCFPNNIDYTYVKEGKHIDRFYIYFKNLQEHRITFLGYNFYGNGGTVSATYALAEALLEKGYLVSLLSLKQNQRPQNAPYGLNMKALYNAKGKTLSEKTKRLFFRRKKLYKYLLNDRDNKNLIPYSGYALEKWLNSYGSETVISTRESLHPFLVEATSDRIKNKLYFYHCSATIFDEIFPALSEQLRSYTPEKAIFVTDNSRKLLIEHFGFEPYKKYLVLGNTLTSKKIITPEEIVGVEHKERYSGVYLLRLSNDRKTDIDNLIDYGKYLRDNDISNIRIYVYGTGDYVNNFLDALIENEVTDYIKYCGFAKNPKSILHSYDAVIDFSINQSFGMTYLEGIFNGKMVCLRNTGSLEVFEDIPEVFYASFDELTQKILNLPNISTEQLQHYYHILAQKYSRDVISSKLLMYLNS